MDLLHVFVPQFACRTYPEVDPIQLFCQSSPVVIGCVFNGFRCLLCSLYILIFKPLRQFKILLFLCRRNLFIQHLCTKTVQSDHFFNICHMRYL